MLLSLKTALLGIIQGITEFLPISSTGHMILVDEFMQIDSVFKESFFVIVQLGSILAVLVYFHETPPVAALRDRELRCQTFFCWKTAVGVIPAVWSRGLWGGLDQSQLYDSAIVASALFLGGIALLAIESRLAGKVEILTPCPGPPFAIGCISAAMIPGVSRSASTILGSFCWGIAQRPVSTRFAVIPTMFAASAYQAY